MRRMTPPLITTKWIPVWRRKRRLRTEKATVPFRRLMVATHTRDLALWPLSGPENDHRVVPTGWQSGRISGRNLLNATS